MFCTCADEILSSDVDIPEDVQTKLLQDYEDELLSASSSSDHLVEEDGTTSVETEKAKENKPKENKEETLSKKTKKKVSVEQPKSVIEKKTKSLPGSKAAASKSPVKSKGKSASPVKKETSSRTSSSGGSSSQSTPSKTITSKCYSNRLRTSNEASWSQKSSTKASTHVTHVTSPSSPQFFISASDATRSSPEPQSWHEELAALSLSEGRGCALISPEHVCCSRESSPFDAVALMHLRFVSGSVCFFLLCSGFVFSPVKHEPLSFNFRLVLYS